MAQFNDEDKKTTSDFLGLLVNLGMTPHEAYKSVNSLLNKQGWTFIYFNDIQDFWICDNETNYPPSLNQ
jgi:hypothetical protein